MSILNVTKAEKQPLYFGEEMGLQTYLSPRYPELYNLFIEQRSCHWIETQVDLSGDQKQWATLPQAYKEITILNLSNQVMMDSLLGRAPLVSLAPFVSNEEYEIMLIEWQRVEATLHSVTYSHMIRSVFPDPERVLEEIKLNAKALHRLDRIKGLFDELYLQSVMYQSDKELNGEDWRELYPEKMQYLRRLLLKTHASIYFLESNKFNASFSMTFALAEQDVMNGFANLLKLISRDELTLHTKMSEAVLRILAKTWPEDWAAVQDEVLELFNEAILGEVEWGKHVLQGSRVIVGYNADILKDYVYYIGKRSLQKIGIQPPDYLTVDKNPIPWINEWLNMSSVQVAPQETEITNYRIGAINPTINKEEIYALLG